MFPVIFFVNKSHVYAKLVKYNIYVKEIPTHFNYVSTVFHGVRISQIFAKPFFVLLNTFNDSADASHDNTPRRSTKE